MPVLAPFISLFYRMIWLVVVKPDAPDSYEDRVHLVLAEQGHARAQYELGGLYNMGKGVEQDYEQAAKWYRRAALQNDADAQCSLGNMYY